MIAKVRAGRGSVARRAASDFVTLAMLATGFVGFSTASAAAETCNGVTVPSQWLGTNSSDLLDGNSNDNTMHGRGGIDNVSGDLGLDDVCGGGSGDLVDGGAGADYVQGGDGCDAVYGGGGNDVLHGGFNGEVPPNYAGCDFEVPGALVVWGGLRGEDGNDVLWGGQGIDYLEGGSGTDEAHGDSEYDFCDLSNESGFSCEEWV